MALACAVNKKTIFAPTSHKTSLECDTKTTVVRNSLLSLKASACNLEQKLRCMIMFQLHRQQGSSQEEAIHSSPATRRHPAPDTHPRTVHSPEEAFLHRPPSTCHHLTCTTLREAMEVKATSASPTRPSAWASFG